LTGGQLQGADLGEAELQGADLRAAQLQGAKLGGARLQGADLREARLQGTYMVGAQLQGANLGGAELQGAKLGYAQLQGADLGHAQLQGADLGHAQLQGAKLGGARLQGANLWKAQLQGANLRKAQLQGADLRKANLYGAEGPPSESGLIDAREVVWKPLPEDESQALSNELKIRDNMIREYVLGQLAAASRPGAKPQLKLQSCLARSDAPLLCGKLYGGKRYDPDNPAELAAFKQQLQAYLGKLACESSWIAQGLIMQIPAYSWKSDSSRQGLDAVLKKGLEKKCPGLQGLSPEWKDKLKAIK
jgi:hypothetical protein